MKAELYFKCPICGKTVLKSRGQMLMFTMICKGCYKKMRDSEIKVKNNNMPQR